MGIASKVAKSAGSAVAGAAKRAAAGVPKCQLCRKNPGTWFRHGMYVCTGCKSLAD